MRDAEVVVIGAGVAGLAAFQHLRSQGCDALLLEARSRIGGRIHTDRVPGWPLPIELGAEFIHGTPAELMPLADADADHGDRRDWTSADGVLRAAGEFAGGADKVFERMAAIRPPLPDRSFAAFLDECEDCPASARAGALGYIEGFEAADPNRISVYSLNREQEADEAGGGPQPHRPRNGYGQLLASLHADGRALLRTAVRTVRWQRGKVALDADQSGSPVTFRARRVIVTVPLRILQASLFDSHAILRFAPPLEAKRAALDGLAMGAARRLTLRLREPFWQELRDEHGHRLGPLGFLFSQSPAAGHFPTWWTTPGGAQITGWAAGRHAEALTGQTREFLRQRALADLGRLLGVAPRVIEGLLLEIHTYDWQADEFSAGAYSYARVGGADAHGWLAEPLEDTLFFAGEATDAAGHHATVHGALRSGLRMARRALRNPER